LDNQLTTLGWRFWAKHPLARRQTPDFISRFLKFELLRIKTFKQRWIERRRTTKK
jgi:hypothetical protein